MKPIAIRNWKSIVPGNLSWDDLALGKTAITLDKKLGVAAGVINKSNSTLISQLSHQHKNYKQLDRSTLLALSVSDKLETLPTNLGVNFGSSRGATTLLEDSIIRLNNAQSLPTSTSPNTTLGNLSSWVGNHIGNQGIHLSHSITCSTGLHAILNGVAWIQAGMAENMLCGASEAPLTKYTVAQMQALKIYSKSSEKYACQSMVWNKANNTMVLGEAATAILLGNKQSDFAITGVGWGTEQITHPADLSTQGECMQRSMRMALKNANTQKVDAIVMHAPGTIKGDNVELNAIKAVFGNQPLALTSNKWAFGHTFATSGLLSFDMALYMLQNQKWIPNPLNKYEAPTQLKTIMINAVGFGANAVSVVISCVN